MHPDGAKYPADPGRPVGLTCPDCGTALAGAVRACPQCALPLAGPVAAELWQVDGALAGLKAREAQLRLRRDHLMTLLRAERTRLAAPGAPAPVDAPTPRPADASAARPADGAPETEGAAGAVPGDVRDPATTPVPGRLSGPSGAPGGPGGSGGPGGLGEAGGSGGGGRGAGGEVSRRTAQNLLLILGGLLLTVAAVVFTVVSWGHLGIAGRGAILAGITGVALAVPFVLARRGLNATAETVGVIALALMLLDGYAAYRVGLLGGVFWKDYLAGALALVAVVAAGYGRVVPLRVPPVISMVLAQLPLPLLLDANWTQTAAAFTVTTALNVAVWSRARRMAIWVTATICLGLSAAIALLVAAVASVIAAAVLPSAGLLVVLAGLGVAVALRSVRAAQPVPPAGSPPASVFGPATPVPLAGSALALVFALVAPVRRLVGPEWQVLPYSMAALVVTGLALLLPVALRRVGAACGAVLAVVAALPFVTDVLAALFGPFRHLAGVWGKSPFVADEFVRLRAAVVLLVVFAGVCALVVRWWAVLAAHVGEPRKAVPAEGASAGEQKGVPGRAAVGLSRGLVLGAGLGFAVVAALVAPVAFGAGYGVCVGVPLVLAVLLSVAALRYPAAGWVAGVAAVEAVVWALAVEAATYVTLGVLLLAWGVLFRRRAALVGAALSGGLLVWAVLGGLGARVLAACAVGLAAGAVLALLGGYGMRKENRRFAEVLAIVLAGAAVLPVADVVLRGVTAYAPLADPWTGLPDVLVQRPLVVLALVMAGAVLTLATRPATAPVVGAVLMAVLPVAIRLPYALVLVLLVAGTAAMAAPAARPRTPGRPRETQPGRGQSQGALWDGVAVAVAIWLGTLAIGYAAAEQVATLAVLPVLAAIAAAAAVWGRAKPVGTVLAALLAVAEVVAVAQAHGLRAASLVCAGAGVVAVGAGFWRRVKAVGYLGTAFLMAASWLRLWAEDVEVIEAYTVPFSLVLLGIGWWHGRGGRISSWKAYGAGLLFTFGPSLAAEPTALRSLLLGAVALGVTVAGARFRLQAPAVLGAVTLGVVAVRELAPWVGALVAATPRWVPIAVGGLLLLVIGATYEARKRDVVRLKNAVARLR